MLGAVYGNTSGYDRGGAYQFDGISNMIVLENKDLYDTRGAFSIELWMNVSKVGGYQDIIAKHDGGGGGADAYLIRLNGSEVEVLLGAQDGYFQENTTNAGIVAGQFNHLGVTYNGAAGVVDIYLNGVNLTTTLSQAVPSSLLSTLENITLGGFQGPSPHYYNGSLDDVQLLNATLSSSQIKAWFENKSMTVVNDSLIRGQVWQGTITPNDGTTDGPTNSSNSVAVLQLNVAPLITTPLLSPTPAYKNNTLLANVTYSDANGDLGTVYFWWYRNSTNVFNDTKTGVAAGEVLSTLLPGNFSHFDNLSVIVGVYDGVLFGDNRSSSVVQIQNSLPSVPLLIAPNGSTTVNLTPALSFNRSTDGDGDVVRYALLIDNNIAFNNPEVNVSEITDNGGFNVTTNTTTELSVDTVYYWKVLASDGFNSSSYSGILNFTVSSYLVLNVLQGTVNFGSAPAGSMVNTSNTSIAPFRIENGGNIISNVTITGTNYFSAINTSSQYYQFNVEANESNAFDWSKSSVNWTNMTFSSVVAHVVAWDFHSWKNDALVNLLVHVPVNETPGNKNSTVTFSIG